MENYLSRKSLTKISVWLVLPLFSSTLISAPEVTPKHVSVAAEDITIQKLQRPESKGSFSHSSMLPIYQSGTHNLAFDAQEGTPILFLSPNAEQWQMTVTDPNGGSVIRETKGNSLAASDISFGQDSFKGKTVLVENPVSGNWQVTLTNTEINQTQDSKPQGYLLFKGDPKYQLYTHLDNNITTENQSINLVAYMVNAGSDSANREMMLQKRPMQNLVASAKAVITTPSGLKIQLNLNDSGTNGDQVAGDGQYSAKVPTNASGVYQTQVQVFGTRPDGTAYSRTSNDIYRIEPQSYALSNKPARMDAIGGTKTLINVPVSVFDASQPVFLAAEVWGTDNQGKMKAASWIGGVSSAITENDQSYLQLSFDYRWLQREEVNAPYQLRNIRLQTADTNVPLSILDSLALNAPMNLNYVSNTLRVVGEKTSQSQKKPATRDMLMGNAPTLAAFSTAEITPMATPKLLLVHGYCSGKVWNAGSFTNAAEFQDYNKNRSHEQFALQILNFGAPYSSYGIIAHSQGGAASVHLYSRYWSGLDYATGGRLIQSVGTPYRGTALAGNLAALGEIFGVGCGTNTDLTYTGASNWLSTIPSWARAEVDYYTTTFNDRWWAYDYCHLGSDLLLSDPEDGTTENWAGQLSGAVNKGLKSGWCHTTGMRDPAQYNDSSRNSSMNSRAAR